MAEVDAEKVYFTTFYPSEVHGGGRCKIALYALKPAFYSKVQTDATKMLSIDGQISSVVNPMGIDIKIGTLITVYAASEQVNIEPQQVTKSWRGDWTAYYFDFDLPDAEDITSINVHFTIFVEGVEIASLTCNVQFYSHDQQSEVLPKEAYNNVNNVFAAPYQNIFISYSRKDMSVVRQYQRAQEALGNDVFLDVDDLRAGEDWRTGLAKAIDNAEVFQLFWSVNSAQSIYCQYEWEYALEHRCPDNDCKTIIRPFYWTKPMPNIPASLQNLHFKYVSFEDSLD